MQYEVVFDITQSGYQTWWFPAVGLVFLTVSAGLIYFTQIPRIPSYLSEAMERFYSLGNLSTYSLDHISPYKTNTRKGRLVFLYLFFCFSVVWTVVTFFSTYSDYVNLRNAFQNGQFDFVEGQVTQFVPVPYEGHTDESFVVDGKRFKYADGAVSNGFNNTNSHGGPIRSGLQVRVWSVNNRHQWPTIVRLEVDRNP